MTGPPLRVLLVDDQPTFRRAAARLIATVEGLQVVGEATTGEEAIAMVESLGPEVVLMDVRMPGMDGVEATRRIRAGWPTIRVLLVSSSDPASLPPGLESCGADRFVRKDEIGVEFLHQLLAPAGD